MKKLCALSLLLSLSGIASADVITTGIAFTVADTGYIGIGPFPPIGPGPGPGTHFHPPQGIPSFGAQVGRTEELLFAEELRGLAEFNLTGLSAASPVYVTFEVVDLDGIFDFDIDIFAYRGNNLADLSDFQISTLGLVTSVSPDSLAGLMSIPITTIFNSAIAAGDDSLGIRFQIAPGTQILGSSITFDYFRLTDEDLTIRPLPIPEPATAFLLAAGFGGIYLLRRKNV